jgi:hypothetical protein|tara:strand:+ start:1771 stop:1974 length:204 start_codon:yes stop_codon:yes gene_type:complete
LKKQTLWLIGFLDLFLINVLVESIILPYLDLENTPKNDLYFQIWWAFVITWFIFGKKLLDKLPFDLE